MKSYTLFFVLVSLLWPLSSSLFAQTPIVALPEAEIRAYLERHKVPLIDSGPNPRLRVDYQALWLKWFQRVIAAPSISRLEVDEPMRQRCARFITSGIKLAENFRQRDPAFTSLEMEREARELIGAGIDDPLIHWLHGWSINASSLNFNDAEAAYKRAISDPEDLSPPLQLLVMRGFNALLREAKQSSKSAPKPAEIIEAAWMSAHDGSYLREDDEVFYENMSPIFVEEVFATNPGRIRELCDTHGLSEWSREMLNGQYYDRKAWLARGHGFAYKVDEKGWVGFELNRAKAVESFRKAWSLDPTRPSAPRCLLSIGLTGGPLDEDPLIWLKRAVDAQFDYYPTFSALMNGYLPRWGGTHEQMLGFGFACALTARFDTDVPAYFFSALRYVVADGGDWHRLLRQPLIKAVALALRRQAVHDAATPAMKQDAQAMLAGYAWMCGDFKTAAEALEQVPGSFSRRVVMEMLSFRGWSERLIRGETAIAVAGHQQTWEKAEASYARHDSDLAEELYQRMLPSLKGAARELVSGRLAGVKVERALATGAWVTLPVEPTLEGWQIQKGNWSGTADGRLVNRGLGTSAFIYHTARVGKEFQIRGEFESESYGFGIVLGHGYDGDGRERWLTCVQNKTEAFILNNYHEATPGRRKIDDSVKHSRFLITCHAGTVTFEINGRPVFENELPRHSYEPHEPLECMEDGHVGFCHWLFKNGKVSSLMESEVRLLPKDYRPPQAASPE